MDKFLSCDWGTSAFRLKLVDIPTMTVIAEEATVQGVASMFARWKENGENEDRRPFFLSYLKTIISALEKKLDATLAGVPLVMSGMITSTMGMIELPYKEFPISLGGHDLVVEKINSSEDFHHDVTLISGARTADDVIRGEETQLIGCCQNLPEPEGLFIFPGTHSKHIVVKGGSAIAFKTYMTGEFFELLSRKSILSASVEVGTGLQLDENRESFQKGLLAGIRDNLLHSAFLVRTNQLFKVATKGENHHYLSGLLIGTELRDVVNSSYKQITIVGNPALNEHYSTAFQLLNTHANFASVKTCRAEEALIKGQWKVFTENKERGGVAGC